MLHDLKSKPPKHMGRNMKEREAENKRKKILLLCQGKLIASQTGLL